MQRSLKFLVCFGALCLLSIALSTNANASVQFSTSVAPLEGEDLATACHYDLLIFDTQQTQSGVLVIFGRGDSLLLYEDDEIRKMASSLHYAMLFAHQCNAATFNDIQPQAFWGPGRALFQALDQFAADTKHPELHRTGVILYGFSAAGVLTATFTNFAPSRIQGAIVFAPGSSYLNLDTVQISQSAVFIPTLILANSKDPLAGTTHGLSFFERGWEKRARWAFGVQNLSGHCCDETLRSLLLAWIPAVALRPTEAGNKVNPGMIVHFMCSPDGTRDGSGEIDCEFTKASIVPERIASEQSGWLPDAPSAAAWLAWVTNPSKNQ